MARPKKAATETPQEKIEAPLFATADKLRGAMDASEYKHVVLGLIWDELVRAGGADEEQNQQSGGVA